MTRFAKWTSATITGLLGFPDALSKNVLIGFQNRGSVKDFKFLGFEQGEMLEIMTTLQKRKGASDIAQNFSVGFLLLYSSRFIGSGFTWGYRLAARITKQRVYPSELRFVAT